MVNLSTAKQKNELMDGTQNVVEYFAWEQRGTSFHRLASPLRYHYARLPSHSTLHNQTNLRVLPLSAILPEHPG